MSAVFHLLIVFLAARLCGRLATLLHQPASIGEVLGGALLALVLSAAGPDLPLLAGLRESETLAILGELGIFLLLLATGIEMAPREIAEHSREAVLVALGGMLLPLGLGLWLGLTLLPESELRHGQALILGIGLSISAIPVAAKVFMEMGLLHQPVGEIVIAAALIDDVLGLILLAVATHLILQGGLPDLAALVSLIASVGLFFAVTGITGRLLYGPLWRRLQAWRIPGSSLTALVALALLYGLLAHWLGLHFVLGPFVAGLFFEARTVGEAAHARAKQVIGTVTSAFAGPVFFAWIGLQLDLAALATVPGFLAALLAVAILGKLIGAGIPALWSGLDLRHAAAIGIGLSGRGAVELVIAGIAQKAGVFTAGNGAHPIVSNLFSALVITAVVTTLLVPLGLRLVLPAKPQRSKA